MKAWLIIEEKFKKFKTLKKVFSLDLLLKFNWVLTVVFFLLVLFFALWIWWKSFVSLSSPLSPESIGEENSQGLEDKNQKIKNIIDQLEKRKANFDNFPQEALPREKVFKSDFIWEEESASTEDQTNKQETTEPPEERLIF